MAATVNGKVAMVTGASSGIGEAIAIMLASRGAKVTLCGRDQGRLEIAVEKCTKASGGHKNHFQYVVGDINLPDVRTEMVQKTVTNFGQLDLLVANAGISLPDANILTATEEVYDKIMDTNLKSIFFLIQTALPALEKAKGSIVTISSIFSGLPTAKQTIYAASKAGLDHLTQSLAVALGPKGIRVNAVNPSYIATRVVRNYSAKVSTEEISEVLRQREDPKHPLHARCCKLEELAEVVLFLGSEAASFVTGQCVMVDGGRHFNQNELS